MAGEEGGAGGEGRAGEAYVAGPEYAWHTARAMLAASPSWFELIGMPSTVTQGTHVCGGRRESVAARA